MKLKYIAIEMAKKWLGQECSDGNFDKDDFGYYQGFQDGAKWILNFFEEKLQEELKKLEPYPIMNERRIAMTKMLQKIKEEYKCLIE